MIGLTIGGKTKWRVILATLENTASQFVVRENGNDHTILLLAVGLPFIEMKIAISIR